MRTFIDIASERGNERENAMAWQILADLAYGNPPRITLSTWSRARRKWRKTVGLFRNLNRHNPEGLALDYLIATKCRAPSKEILTHFRLNNL